MSNSRGRDPVMGFMTLRDTGHQQLVSRRSADAVTKLADDWPDDYAVVAQAVRGNSAQWMRDKSLSLREEDVAALLTTVFDADDC
ncbi:TPA: hypothetical protein ACOEQX_004297 [Stenotrophomonas maltophilia]